MIVGKNSLTCAFTVIYGGVYVSSFAHIGANSTIMPGVKIGRYTLIGAGSVVTKDVEDYSVVAGNPACFIKEITDLVCHQKFFEKPYEWEEWFKEL